jgi:hypothetical protein
MSGISATVLAAVVSAGISIIVASISYAASQAATKAKLDELKQNQMLEIIRERIQRYPSLWKICHEDISNRTWTESKDIPAGWEQELFDKLQHWNTENGAFVSEECYVSLWHLRKRLSGLIASPTQGEEALRRLQDIENIWVQGYTDEAGIKHSALATLMKDDLGSYWKAALSIRY